MDVSTDLLGIRWNDVTPQREPDCSARISCRKQPMLAGREAIPKVRGIGGRVSIRSGTLHCAFCTIDKDENGTVSIEEFKQACEDGNALDIGALFDEIDMDGSGCIEYTEFIAACMDRKIEEHESICWSAFQVFDQDGNGTISYNELAEVMKTASMKDTFSEELMDELWTQLLDGDTDVVSPSRKDQSIDFDHFLATLRGVRAASLGASSRAEAPAAEAPAAAGALGGGLPIASRGLPIARRHGGAAAALGLPVKSRSSPGGVPGLPVASRGGGGAPAAGPAGGGLPGLPVASRRR
ncbi:unnamed protein product [Prorocentrum cordatum]|uniref:EF-hand domain-containing protein n=1 Tax=Prorocentrum cordatum TaxID=2364126 RepID=A0ABN9VTQ4_9DINO|nr:unnamed protein product [Polarella glacialis]